MSMEVFPDLPGLDIAVQRIAIHSTKILTSASGKELRATFWDGPRYRYVLQTNCLLALGVEGALIDQIEELQSFFDRHRGAYDSFLFDDPVDGERRRVRFDMDDLELTRVANGIWEGRKLELISQK